MCKSHIDTKENTPGALDNASGITVLLLLTEMLRDYSGPSGIEIVAINGEDHCSAGGEMDYLKRYSRGIKDIRLAVNIDDAGYKVSKTAFSTYNIPPKLETTVKAIFGKLDGLVPGDQWYQVTT